MRTYRVAPLRRETDGWTVIRSIPGEQDETLGHYSERADAQAAWERLVAAKAKGDFEFGGPSPTRNTRSSRMATPTGCVSRGWECRFKRRLGLGRAKMLPRGFLGISAGLFEIGTSNPKQPVIFGLSSHDPHPAQEDANAANVRSLICASRPLLRPSNR